MLLSEKKKKGLLSESPRSPRPLGTLEEGIDKRVPVIFPTHSPVNMLGGQPNTKAPRALGTSVFKKLSKIIMEKLSPLINVKKDMDDVYSKGYFENHYPDADKKLKGLLHDRAMAAISHSENDEVETHEDEGESKITLVVNINK